MKDPAASGEEMKNPAPRGEVSGPLSPAGRGLGLRGDNFDHPHPNPPPQGGGD